MVQVEGEAVTRCQILLPAKVLEALQHYASRKAMDIDGLGEGMSYWLPRAWCRIWLGFIV